MSKLWIFYEKSGVEVKINLCLSANCALTNVFLNFISVYQIEIKHARKVNEYQNWTKMAKKTKDTTRNQVKNYTNSTDILKLT